MPPASIPASADSAPSARQPAWLRDAVFYQIYPQSFCDSDGDGIGDLPGLISKLDYLRSLGVTALWLSPIFDSPMGDAGYDVRDFRRVAPRYGTQEDAVRLFREARARGLRVVLDLVAGHTSDQHPWFRAAAADPRSPYRDFFIFTGDAPQKPIFGDTIPRTVSGEHYVANFLPFQPALNFGYLRPDPSRPWERPAEHPGCLAVRHELREIMRFWLDLGCDGFRVDMASSLIKGDPDAVALRRLWQGFRAWLDADYPEAVLVSEWSNPRQAIDAGFHIDFLIMFGVPAYIHLFGPGSRLKPGGARVPHAFFERAGEGDIRLFLDPWLEHFHATKGRGYISVPTGNHDFARPSRGRDADELRVIHTQLLTFPGTPFIYYGDEIGLRNLDGLPEKEGSLWRSPNRTPMQWTAHAPNHGFSTAPADQLYLPVDPAADAPTVSAQEADPDSLLHFVRRLLALRRAVPALGNDGDLLPLYAHSGCYPFIYERRSPSGERAIVVVNPAADARRAEWPGHADAFAGARLLFGRGVSVDADAVRCEGLAHAIFAVPAA